MSKYENRDTRLRSSHKGCKNNQHTKSNLLDHLEGYFLYLQLAVNVCLVLYLPKYTNKQSKCLQLLRRICAQGYMTPRKIPRSGSYTLHLFSLLRYWLSPWWNRMCNWSPNKTPPCNQPADGVNKWVKGCCSFIQPGHYHLHSPACTL